MRRFHLWGLPPDLATFLRFSMPDCGVDRPEQSAVHRAQAQLEARALVLLRPANALSIAQPLATARNAGQPVFLLYPDGLPAAEPVPWLAEVQALDLAALGAEGLTQILRQWVAPQYAPALPRPILEMVPIPPGEFWMGSSRHPASPGFDPEAHLNEFPAHHQVLSHFFLMGRHPVTNAEYRPFVEATGAASPIFWKDPRFQDPLQPVVGITHAEALAYCAWLGPGYDLPREVQWEWAARSADQRKYPWGEAPPEPDLACFGLDLQQDGPARVGQHPKGAGPFGVQDQAGRGWEWCRDPWAAYPGAAPFSAPEHWVIRGGGWSGLGGLRVAARGHASQRSAVIGFRVVCDGRGPG